MGRWDAKDTSFVIAFLIGSHPENNETAPVSYTHLRAHETG